MCVKTDIGPDSQDWGGIDWPLRTGPRTGLCVWPAQDDLIVDSPDNWQPSPVEDGPYCSCWQLLKWREPYLVGPNEWQNYPLTHKPQDTHYCWRTCNLLLTQDHYPDPIVLLCDPIIVKDLVTIVWKVDPDYCVLQDHCGPWTPTLAQLLDSYLLLLWLTVIIDDWFKLLLFTLYCYCYSGTSRTDRTVDPWPACRTNSIGHC